MNKTLHIYFFLSIIQGAYLENIPLNLEQPDGAKINCFATGDEFYVRLHDENNYTIIQSQEDGYYYYAQSIDNKVIPSIYRADKFIPQGLPLNKSVKTPKVV